MLEVTFLGTFAIKCDGKPVTLSLRAAQSLFAYLILTAGTLHRREKLAGMLWPDETEEKARAYLSNELWRIRKMLSHASKAEYLLVDSLTIGFDPSAPYQLDVTRLENVSDDATADELIGLLSLYKGELLPGFYEDWIVFEREHLYAIYETKMARLLGLLESEKRWHEILDWAERWILLGEKPETAYQALMVAYNGLGDHAKVASTYERCVRALRELDVEPSEKTRSLAFNRTSKLHLPIPLTSFIGREKELKEVADLFSQSRLVTLTGSGGVGKTRLAIQAVADLLKLFPDGVWFLDLAPLNDPKLVPNTLAEVLDLQLRGGSDLSFPDLIIGYLRSRRALVILDNCEHVIESCAQLAHSLVTSCGHLSILATSREALRVSGEIPYRVPSLELPSEKVESAVDAIAKTEAVRLFMERAVVVSPGFVLSSQNALVIIQICRRLDGIPLAIELAAARTTMLTVEQILKRLDDRFNLLRGGLRTELPRHQTLRATIEWSYDLLSEQERRLFQRLAVFVGGWTLEAAEEVCRGNSIKRDEVLDLLSQLVHKSLVLVETVPYGTRYRRLETIRQFACEKLAASLEEEQIRNNHLAYFLKLAQEAELGNHSPQSIEWVEKLEDEQENLRAALEWSLRGDVKAGQQLAVALKWWWDRDGPNSGGYEWIQRMLAVPVEIEPLMRAKLLDAAGWLSIQLASDEQQLAFAEESLALFQQLGNKEGMASTLWVIGAHAFYHSNLEQAAALFEERYALYRETGTKWGQASSLCGLGIIAQAQGNFEQAQEFYEESLLLSKELGDPGGIRFALFLMAGLAASEGRDSDALKLFEESLQIAKANKAKGAMSLVLNAMGSVAMSSGDYEKGEQWLNEMIDLSEKMGDRSGMASSLHYLAWGALLQGDYAQARSLYMKSLQLLPPLEHDRYIAEYLLGVGQLMAAQGDLQAFARFAGMAARAAPDHHSLLVPRLFITETDKFIDIAQAQLGDEAYMAAWQAGHQLSSQEAVQQALRELQ